jgi:hypothetical protein
LVGTVITSYDKGNTTSATLSATWNNMHLITFADSDGTILYQEYFAEGATSISDGGKARIAEILVELQVKASEGMVVSWENYSLDGKKDDVIVYAVYTYNSYLKLTPIKDANGILIYYQVDPVDELPENVTIPGYVGNVPVKVVNRVTNAAGNTDWDNWERNVRTIKIEYGVEELGPNSLAYTPNLGTVYLPTSLKTMGKNTFSRNFGSDGNKELKIVYAGTMSQWKAVMDASAYKDNPGLFASDDYWYGGLASDTVVICTDGYFLFNGSSWDQYSQAGITENSTLNGTLVDKGLQPEF